MKKLSMSGLYTLTEWITKFAYVNFLWIGFSLLGLIILGFCPSTTAMFTILRKWIMGDSDLPVFKTFWETYKKEFLRSNKLGIILALLAGLVFIDLHYMKIDPSKFLQLAHFPLYLFIFAITMTIMYIFPAYVHYNVSFTQLFKNAFLLMLINPLSNILMIAGIAATVLVMKLLPGLSIFFGGSLIAGIIMSACYQAFQRIERKQKEAAIQ